MSPLVKSLHRSDFLSNGKFLNTGHFAKQPQKRPAERLWHPFSMQDGAKPGFFRLNCPLLRAITFRIRQKETARPAHTNIRIADIERVDGEPMRTT
ncbi:MAG: hypothetical protein ACI9IV_000668 [Paracoccaceae bacterium]|jgi:hypothetical protein